MFAPQVPLQHAPCGGASGGRAGPRAPAGAAVAGPVSPRYISSSNISNFHSIQLPAATRFPCMEVESAAEQSDCQTPGAPAAFKTCELSHPYHVCSNGAQLMGTGPFLAGRFSPVCPSLLTRAVLSARYHYIPPILLAFALYIFGGWAAVGWGFMLSNVLCWHAT